MSKLFKKLPDQEGRTIRCEIRLTEKESAIIGESAHIRNLSVADFIRRAALGRRADVHYETHIVLELRSVVQAIRSLHTDMLAHGYVPPENELKPVIKNALAAMLRISK